MNATIHTVDLFASIDQLIPQALMISFSVIMLQKFPNRIS